MGTRPGGKMASRPLHFIFIVDCSGSMLNDGKIQALNNAIIEALPHMKNVARDNAHTEVLVRAVKFSTGADWHVREATPVEEFQWPTLSAERGVTDLGKALELVASQLTLEHMPQRALPPVLVLISDGQPTDNYEKGLQTLTNTLWGRKAVRLAIAIGDDAQHEPLEKFIGDPAIAVLHASNADALTTYMRFVSTVAIASVSTPSIYEARTQTNAAAPPPSNHNIYLPPPPEVEAPPPGEICW